VDGCNFQVRDLELNADFERHVFHHRAAVVPQFREARIDSPVEDIALKQVNDILGSMYANGAVKETEKVVNENWQAGDVIHMRMRNDDIAHMVALPIGERDGEAASINRHAVVNQVTSQPLLLCG